MFEEQHSNIRRKYVLVLEVGWRSIVCTRMHSVMHCVAAQKVLLFNVSYILCVRAFVFRQYYGPNRQCLECYSYTDAQETNLSSQ